MVATTTGAMPLRVSTDAKAMLMIMMVEVRIFKLVIATSSLALQVGSCASPTGILHHLLILQLFDPGLHLAFQHHVLVVYLLDLVAIFVLTQPPPYRTHCFTRGAPTNFQAVWAHLRGYIIACCSVPHRQM